MHRHVTLQKNQNKSKHKYTYKVYLEDMLLFRFTMFKYYVDNLFIPPNNVDILLIGLHTSYH